tara:strand:- start:744 stop:1067 length:324 start_codon:yes stop_codon:yes gene_type:complete
MFDKRGALLYNIGISITEYNTMSSLKYAKKHYGVVRQPNGSYLTSNLIVIWYNDKGEEHREDGPAVAYTDGAIISWKLYDKVYDFSDWIKLTPIPDEQKLLLRLQYE